MAGFTLGGDFWAEIVNNALYESTMLLCAPKYRIVIDCDGTTTTARLIVNQEKVKEAKAVLGHDDKFSLPIGARVAFERLWEKKPKEDAK